VAILDAEADACKLLDVSNTSEQVPVWASTQPNDFLIDVISRARAQSVLRIITSGTLVERESTIIVYQKKSD
jgi:hypothetical protein